MSVIIIKVCAVCMEGRGGLMISVRSSPNRAVWVQALAWDIVLCSRMRLFTLNY